MKSINSCQATQQATIRRFYGHNTGSARFYTWKYHKQKWLVLPIISTHALRKPYLIDVWKSYSMETTVWIWFCNKLLSPLSCFSNCGIFTLVSCCENVDGNRCLSPQHRRQGSLALCGPTPKPAAHRGHRRPGRHAVYLGREAGQHALLSHGGSLCGKCVREPCS